MRKCLFASVVLGTLVFSSPAYAQEEEQGVFSAVWQLVVELFSGAEESGPAQEDLEPEGRQPTAKSDSPVLFVRPVFVDMVNQIVEAKEGQGQLEVRLRLSTTTERDIEVLYRVEPGSARSPEDFVDSGNGRLKILAGQSAAGLIQSLPDDTVYEGETPENYYIELLEVKGGALGTLVRTEVRIMENDAAPVASVTPGRLQAVPGTVEFGQVNVDSAYDVDIKVRHSGETDVRVTLVEETADRVQIRSQSCLDSLLSPGASCDVRLRFRPDADGEYAGSLILQGQTDANGELQTVDLRVPLRGRGYLEPADPDPNRALRAKMQLKRRLSQGGVVSSVSLPVSPSPREYITSQDYDPAVAPGNAHVTLPIDLERILTTFQSIPCVLENSINSQHPGQAVCVVEHNVYSYHGFEHRYVLIPGGSKFQGTYQPLAKNGDTRLSIFWQRMLKPDGSMMWLTDGFPVQDAMGRTSLPGEIDNKEWEKFGTPLLLTLFTAALTEFVSQGGEEGLSGAQQVLIDGESRVITQMLADNLDQTRVMTISSGSRLIVKPTIDLIFEPTRVRVLGQKAVVQPASTTSAANDTGQGSAEKGSSSEPPSLAAPPTVH